MSSVSSSGESVRAPRNAIRVGLVLLVVVVLYWPDTAALCRYWFDQDVNARAGVLIAFLAAFLLFRARVRFEQVPVRPVPLAGLPLIGCAAVSLICWRAGILTPQLFFLPLICWLALLSVLGLPTARVAGFAIGFLYFAVPGWGLFGPALQHLTAWAVGVIGPLVGLPVAISGTRVLLPGGTTFVIERACSGVDFLTVGLAVATLHGELEQARLRRRAGLIGAMLVLAIVSNWVRVLLIVGIGYRSHMRNPLATSEHLALGWVVFACALLLFVWVAGRLAVAEPHAPVAGGDGKSVAPRTATSRTATYQGHGILGRYGIAAAAVLAVPALLYARLLAIGAPLAGVAFELPPGRASWQGPVSVVDSLWQPIFVGASAERRARYQSVDGRTVEVVAIGFPQQTQDGRILDQRNSLLGDRGLAIEEVALARSAGIPHGEVIALGPDGRRSLIWSVIDIGGRLFGEPFASQLWYGVSSLVGTPYSALFALRTPCEGSCDAARTVLADFLRANGSALFASLPNAGPGV